MDAGFSAEPKRLPETFNSPHAGHQGQDDVQDQGDPDPASVLQLIPVVSLVVVIIYITLAYLQALFYKALHLVV